MDVLFNVGVDPAVVSEVRTRAHGEKEEERVDMPVEGERGMKANFFTSVIIFQKGKKGEGEMAQFN